MFHVFGGDFGQRSKVSREILWLARKGIENIHARMKFSTAKLKVNLAVSNPFLLLFDAIKASTPA